MIDRNALFTDLDLFFGSYWESKGQDPEADKVSTNRFNACMMYIYNNYVCSLEITNNRGTKQYSYSDISNMIEWYIAKCLEYDFITLYGFCLLVNRSKQWLYDIRDNENISNYFYIEHPLNTNDISVVSNTNSNSSVFDNNNSYNGRASAAGEGEKATALLQKMIEKLFSTLQESTVNKLNDTTIGLTVNANNNKDIGLMYAKERIQETAKARVTITLADLPRLD